MNMILQNQNNNQESPFDRIRRFTEGGQEYWLARELMKLLGYKTWQRFNSPIEKAKISASLQNLEIKKHFINLTEEISNKKTKQDYKLSRMACYLIAQNGDSRKKQIAAAQMYFSVQTVRAERVIPEKSDRIKELEMQLKIAQLNKESRELDHAMLTLHGKETVLALRGKEDQLVKVEVPTIEVIDERHDIMYSGQTLAQIKNYLNTTYGFSIKSGAEIERILEAINESGAIGSIPRIVLSKYIPEENLPDVVPKIVEHLQQNRQLLLGE